MAHDEILKNDESSSFLLSLPFQNIFNICQSNNLAIKDEKVLVDLYVKYLAHRDSLPALPEDDPAKDIDKYLSEAEKEARAKEKEEK